LHNEFSDYCAKVHINFEIRKILFKIRNVFLLNFGSTCITQLQKDSDFKNFSQYIWLETRFICNFVGEKTLNIKNEPPKGQRLLSLNVNF